VLETTALVVVPGPSATPSPVELASALVKLLEELVVAASVGATNSKIEDVMFTEAE
jgi:hypothetical protein